MIARMAEKSIKRGITNEKIMEVLLDMDDRMATKEDLQEAVESINSRMATKDDLRSYATKNDLERVKDEILDGIKPVIKAVDKDADIIFDHGKRIVVLERRVGALAK